MKVILGSKSLFASMALVWILAPSRGSYKASIDNVFVGFFGLLECSAGVSVRLTPVVGLVELTKRWAFAKAASGCVVGGTSKCRKCIKFQFDG